MFNVKSALIRCLGSFGGYRLGRLLARGTPRILMYHRFSVEPQQGYVHLEAFERQLAYLKQNFNVLGAGSLAGLLVAGKPVPANSIVITIDDGYHDFYDVAFPAIRKSGMPATLFVTTRFVDGGFWLWPDLVRYILEKSESIKVPKMFGLETGGDDRPDEAGRDVLWGRLVNRLLAVDEAEKNHLLKIFAEHQGVVVPVNPVAGLHAVTWDQVREMKASGIEIGAHSRTHPSLGKIGNNLLKYEIQGSVEDVTRETGCTPVVFCYPNGQPADYNDLAKRYVREAGCHAAVTAFYDRNITNDLFELRRFNVGANWFQFSKVVNGLEVLSARWLDSNNRNYQFA